MSAVLLDFCDKYSHAASLFNSLSNFVNKLEQKNQTGQQIEQAKNAVNFFYKLIEFFKSNSSQSIVQSKVSAEKPKYDSTGGSDVSKNQNCKNEFDELNNENRLKQHSRKTLRNPCTKSG